MIKSFDLLSYKYSSFSHCMLKQYSSKLAHKGTKYTKGRKGKLFLDYNWTN